ncbi:unnamed protein product, partial [Mesorhabditis belari]|uniref:Uncharacterized protein n=1 Tax=Mesorhabditis belari TaxID=2138241 RepID=A0AAF3EK76_9BILA
MYRSLLLVFSACILSSVAQKGILDVGKDIQKIVDELSTDYGVVVTNNCSNSIYLKCASADDAITGDGSDDDDWWTLDSGDTLSWGFKDNEQGTTCFWCYANNNGQDARDSGNWYIHQNVWGHGNTGCDGAPGNNGGVDDNGLTEWEVRDDGMYSNMCGECQDGSVFEKYSDWGPSP